MRIGIVCHPSIGGSGVVATTLGHRLALCGHIVHFITYEVPFRLSLPHRNIHFHRVPTNHYALFRYPDYALTLAVKIAEVSEKEQLDLLHVHYAIPHATSAYLAKQLLGGGGPALVTTLHGTDITLVGRDPAFFKIVKFSIEKSDQITAVSSSLVEETQEYFGIDQPISMIHNFFTPKEELQGSQPLRARFIEKGEKLLVHASNFRPVKRVCDSIALFDLVQKTLPAKLLLLGKGPDLQKARAEVKKRQLEQKVQFLSAVREIDPYLASADLLLLTSFQESFGLVALEAMAYGIPVVGTRVGGIPEVVEEGESGLLADVGDIDQLAHHALRLLSDPELYRKMSEAARKRAEERFSAKKILPHYLAAYERAIARCGARPLKSSG